MAELYNATGTVKTLVGNWQEEQDLVAITGTARCKLTKAGAAGGLIPSSAVHEPTHARVIEHSEREEPKGWASHNIANFQIPHKRIDLLSYPKVLGCGPRQAQELQQMWQQAAAPAQVQEEASSFETTQQAEFQPKTMEGLQVGCKVMNPDGSPARRDPVFLQETGLVPNAGRLMARDPSLGYVRPPSASEGLRVATVTGLTHSSLDPAVPITMYTEAAAKATYNGTFYGTATLGKGLMARNDQFTKLMGDVNKDQRHL